MAVLTALVDCGKCSTTYDGQWPGPAEGEEQDQAEAPVADQVCPECGHVQSEEYPGWSFHTEAG
jgi:hypothetical protein